jgi:rhodanese-related sulfurtransferase
MLAGLLAGGVAAAAAQDAPLISKEKLYPRLGSPDLIIIDVRAGKDWNASEKKIKGAVREDPDKVEAWAKKYNAQQEIVLYCA